MSKLTQAEFYKLATRLRKENPGMTDEELGARLLNEAFGMTDEDLAAPPTAEELAAMPGPQSIDDAVTKRLELAERIGELTRNGTPTGTGRLKTVARPIGKGQKVDTAEQPAKSDISSLFESSYDRCKGLTKRRIGSGHHAGQGTHEGCLTCGGTRKASDPVE
jgi:hypothetical protein